MYVLVHVNNIGVKAMVDTSVTHSFLASKLAARLNMRVEAHASVIITLKGKEQQVNDIAKAIPLQMGAWSGQCAMIEMYM